MKDKRIEAYIQEILHRLALDRGSREKVRADLEESLGALVKKHGPEEALNRFGTPREVAEAFAEAGYRLRSEEGRRFWKRVLAFGVLAAMVLGAATWYFWPDRDLQNKVKALEADRQKLADKLDDAVRNYQPRPETDPKPETGIIQSGEAFPNVTNGMKVANRWQGLLQGDGLMIVFAGSVNNKGVVRVAEVYPDPNLGKKFTVKEIPTPQEHGPVKIMEQRGEGLILEADDGVRFTFNVSRRDFT